MFPHSASWALSYKQNVWSDPLASSTRRTRLKNMIRPIKAYLFIASFPVSRIAVLMVAKAFLAAMPDGVLVSN